MEACGSTTMSSSSFNVCRNLEAVFNCDGPSVNVYFTYEGRRVGRNFTFSRSEAVDLGARIAKTGIWEEFPVSGIDLTDVMSFGERLRLYGVSGN